MNRSNHNICSCRNADEPPTVTRRAFLAGTGGGFGSLALTSLFAADAFTDETAASKNRSAPSAEFNGGLHHRAKAKRVIQLFMNGGASQMDTFDYKTELIKRHVETVDFGLKAAATSVPGPLMKFDRPGRLPTPYY